MSDIPTSKGVFVLWTCYLGCFTAQLSRYGLDVIRRHKSCSTLAQVMAWCLMAPSHYLNQCWLIISSFLRHTPKTHSAWMRTISLHQMSLKNTLVKFLSHRSEANELTHLGQVMHLSLYIYMSMYICICMCPWTGTSFVPEGNGLSHVESQAITWMHHNTFQLNFMKKNQFFHSRKCIWNCCLHCKLIFCSCLHSELTIGCFVVTI